MSDTVTCDLEHEDRTGNINPTTTTDNIDKQENVPIKNAENVPIVISQQVRIGVKRKYVKVKQVVDFATKVWETEQRGFTFRDAINAGLARTKPKAQRMIKYALQTRLVFTINEEKKKPQIYYPSARRAEIIDYHIQKIELEKEQHLKKIAPLDLTGINDPKAPKHKEVDRLRANNLLEVLCLLPNYPLYLHKIQLKLSIHKEFYRGQKELEGFPNYKTKPRMSETFIIDGHRVLYEVYPNRTVMVFIGSTNNPFKLETEADEIALFAYLGQVKERLVTILDNSYGVLPDLMEWFLTACDINKDVEITDMFHLAGIPALQLKIAERVFRMYIKTVNGKAVVRAEESLAFGNIPLGKGLRSLRDPDDGLKEWLEGRLGALKDELLGAIIDQKRDDEAILARLKQCELGGSGQ